MATIRNPVLWGWDQFKGAVSAVESASHDTLHETQGGVFAGRPTVRRIGLPELRKALAGGLADFGANRTDVIFLCVIYPVVGLILGRMAFGFDVIPLLFPLAAGFALIGPFAAIGLYEFSRRREQGEEVRWADAFSVFRAPSFNAILRLGLLLAAIFVFWLVVAQALYDWTLGPDAPASVGFFLHEVFHTTAGWVMAIFGVGIGFLFAVLVLSISVVSFPLLLDRPEVTVGTAIATSVRAVRANPTTMAVWGLIIAGGLVIGSIPFLIGLAIVMPVFGHATWHLYRQLVPR